MSESSDREMLDLIRRNGPLTVVEMGARLGVTGTAVRNRLARLLGMGLVERKSDSCLIASHVSRLPIYDHREALRPSTRFGPHLQPDFEEEG